MLSFTKKANNFDDIIVVINDIYPKYKDLFEKIVACFQSNVDASDYFVRYYRQAHQEIHDILGHDFPRNTINEFLHDFWLMSIKYDRETSKVCIPSIFYNFNAVHYYHSIKHVISMQASHHKEYDKLLESLVFYEKSRHEQNICDCENGHRMIEVENLKDLFNNLITYYLNTNKFEKKYPHNNTLAYIN